MAETLRDACTPRGTQKWHWYSVLDDLVSQGGLEKKEVEWSFTDAGAFLYKGKPFIMTWAKDQYLLVSMEQDDEDFSRVVDALTKVVEYGPFCKYVEPENKMHTYEWDKSNPEERFKELQKGRMDLVKIE